MSAAIPSAPAQVWEDMEKVTPLVVPSSSVADAVRPTSAVFAAFSATVFAALLESAGDDTSNSSKSDTAIVNCVDAVLPSVLVARIVTVQDCAVS